jgi:uncharacterized phiE125 gp8 family phage protein
MLTGNPTILKPKFNLVTAPTTEPVTVEEFHAHAHTTDLGQDAKIEDFLKAARLLLENEYGRAWITQTWKATIDAEYSGITGRPYVDEMLYGYRQSASACIPRIIELARPPLIGVSTIVYYLDDGTDTSTEFDDAKYYVSTTGLLGRVMLRTSQQWPSGLRPIDSIVITYTCGYGAATAVPQDVKEAIIELAAHMYENREGAPAANAGGAVVLNRGAFIPSGVQAKLAAYRIPKL